MSDAINISDLDEYRTIGKNIFYFRLKNGWSPKSLATQILEKQGFYISPQKIKDYESGFPIPAVTLHRISCVFRINIEEFFELHSFEEFLNEPLLMKIENDRITKAQNPIE